MESQMREIQILVPPVAVLRNGELYEAGMTRYFLWMAGHGISGLFLNGSTGEFTILSDEQKVETVRIARRAVESKMFLIAGAIAGSPELVCGLAARYKEAGADAVAVCPPPFFRHGQPGIIRFMREVADRSVLPVYLYDIPAFTSPMSFDTIVQLSSHRNICGLKDSSRDFARFEGLLSTIKAQRPEFRIYTGSEELLLVSLVMGADGATVATGGIEPDRIMEIVRAWRAGDLNRARQVQSELLPLIRSWFAEDFPEGFRKAVAAKGFL
ncbi:dihydrodipicolinate synthase family protein [Victivallaceae bacterium BBE-744-WT-12]|uniref:Dihydrodipicolinate synthase family protein n=2 Tax=Victivallis lenta TaxID=2606640 RepID=A0A844G6U2_9BACT|nr:dihydrodipicolinate synthase family protein [Victivallis lenta]